MNSNASKRHALIIRLLQLKVDAKIVLHIREGRQILLVELTNVSQIKNCLNQEDASNALQANLCHQMEGNALPFRLLALQLRF